MKASAIFSRPYKPWRTLASVYEHGEDNFLLLRIIAAAFVMFGHSYGFSGKPNHGDFIARSGWGDGIYTGSVAVDIFFVVSGFLVTGSYLNRANLEVFLKSRVLRILPAYAACVILCALVLGAVFTTLPLREYWSAHATFHYIYVNMQFGTQLIWNLPGVFVHNFYPDAVNGSLWTLPAEVRMYVWVAILGTLGVLRRRWLANIIFALIFLLGILAPDYLPLVPTAAYLELAGSFLAGALCFVNRDWIPVHSAAMVALVLLAIVTHHTFLFPCTFGAALTYLSLWFAYVPNFHFFNRFGDYSYGLYLWGFPVQQSVSAVIGVPVHPWVNFSISFLITLGLAIASWHLLERPALRLKASVVHNTPAERDAGLASTH